MEKKIPFYKRKWFKWGAVIIVIFAFIPQDEEEKAEVAPVKTEIKAEATPAPKVVESPKPVEVVKKAEPVVATPVAVKSDKDELVRVLQSINTLHTEYVTLHNEWLRLIKSIDTATEYEFLMLEAQFYDMMPKFEALDGGQLSDANEMALFEYRTSMSTASAHMATAASEVVANVSGDRIHSAVQSADKSLANASKHLTILAEQ